jgi:hypothetical protein
MTITFQIHVWYHKYNVPENLEFVGNVFNAISHIYVSLISLYIHRILTFSISLIHFIFSSKGDSSSSGTDVYEKTLPKHGDRWFHKFVSVVQKNPGQVIR